MLKKVLKAIIDVWFLLLIGGLLILWGYLADGWIRIGFGCLLIFWAIRAAIEGYKIDRQIEKWFIENEGKIVFFYPTKKQIQNQIKEEILPLFPDNILQAYYEGPKIVGDLENINFLMKRIMFLNPKVRPHNPSILKVHDSEIEVVDELKLLMTIGDGEYDLEEIKRRINRACG